MRPIPMRTRRGGPEAQSRQRVASRRMVPPHRSQRILDYYHFRVNEGSGISEKSTLCIAHSRFSLINRGRFQRGRANENSTSSAGNTGPDGSSRPRTKASPSSGELVTHEPVHPRLRVRTRKTADDRRALKTTGELPADDSAEGEQSVPEGVEVNLRALDSR